MNGIRLYLFNPGNPLGRMSLPGRRRGYRVCKPLGLMVIAGETPANLKIIGIKKRHRHEAIA
jgi:hypothetical protein